MNLFRSNTKLLIAALPLLLTMVGHAQAFELMRTHEATIEDIHAAITARDITCRQLVQMYLARIAAYDKQGPALNAIVVVNPDALSNADEIDAHFVQSGFVGPLHCVPMIVKDNYDIVGVPTTAGSLSLKNSMPPRDAFQVRKLREAGAIVLAKSNMAEFARSPFETVNSLVPGHTRNPYALDRVPAGSSGGTAAAVAANFGAAGLGTDTGNSIRGPSSHASLVGIRSTMGLTSRAGIVPLFLDRDIGGPMARTVADAVAIFDVIAGTDPDDSVTTPADSRRPASYLSALDRDGLKGARIAVVRQFVVDPGADPDVIRLFEQALIDMKRQGAEVVEGINIPEIDQIPLSRLGCDRFKADINAYLATLGAQAPMKSLDEIVASQKFHPSVHMNLLISQAEPPPDQNPRCEDAAQNRNRLAQGVLKAMDGARLDALVYPTWNNPPRLIGDLNSPHGNNSNRLSPPTGFPAMTVPMGFVRGALPAGLQILGRPWSEATLFKIAYSYEQATRHRRPPMSTPPIP
ncbi:MAG TPA: amidase family protein [Xanthobacteraceae bacterium]|nr:amidase family protein [Xanthobacteraceae bacterium]